MSAPITPPTSPAPRTFSGKLISCKVLLLDDTMHSFHVPMKSTGQVLFDEVVRKLRLLESDYFDLEYTDVRGVSCWIDHDKPILRQLPQHGLSLRFIVKFYTPDPGSLEEEFTRYLFALQIKRDLISGSMPCQEHTAILLASFIVQAEFGDFVEDEFGPDPSYTKYYALLPHQGEECRRRLMDHHKELAGQLPAVAEYNLLDTARKVELYGIQMHPARDHEGVALQLSVAHMGVLVFQSLTKINTFSWAKIRKLSFKRKKFLVKLHPEGYGYYKDTVEFYFDSRNACKNFWKRCIEHHAFFRCQTVKRVPRNRPRVVSRGSSFRYSGRTQKQLLEYVRDSSVKRPEFHRSTSMRTMSPSFSASATPRSGTLNSRELRNPRATSAPGGSRRASRSTTCICTSVEQLRSSTIDKGSKRAGGVAKISKTASGGPPPKQSKSLQAIQKAADVDAIEVIDDAEAARNDYEAADSTMREHSHTLPFAVDRNKPKASTSTTRDDFHHIYHFEQSVERLHDIEMNNVDVAAVDEGETVCCFNGNLSQDSYRVTDSRDSSIDRLESRDRRRKSRDVQNGYERCDVSRLVDDVVDGDDGLPQVTTFDRDRIVTELRLERLSREITREEKRDEDEQIGSHEAGFGIADEEVPATDTNEIDDVKFIKAERLTSDSATDQSRVRHTEIICIETTRIVQTVEREVTYTNIVDGGPAYDASINAPGADESEYDRKRKRLSRESAVRIVDEDSVTADETAVVKIETACDAITMETNVGIDNGFGQNRRVENEESVSRACVKNTGVDDSCETGNDTEQTTVCVAERWTAVTDDLEDVGNSETRHERPSGNSGEPVTITDSENDGITEKQAVDTEDEPFQQETPCLDVTAAISDATERYGCRREIQSIENETVDAQPVRRHNDVINRKDQPEHITDQNLAPSSDETKLSDLQLDEVHNDVINDRDVHRAPETDVRYDDERETNSAEQRSQSRVDVDSTVQVVVWAAVDGETETDTGSRSTTENESRPYQTSVAETGIDDEDIQYVLHKRTLQHPADFRPYSSLPSRSRSASPRRGPHPSATVPPLTREQKRAQMEKVKASLVSMASSLPSRPTARSPGAVGGRRRVVDYVAFNRLPPRDSFSSIDHSVSPPPSNNGPDVSGEHPASRTDSSAPTASSDTVATPVDVESLARNKIDSVDSPVSSESCKRENSAAVDDRIDHITCNDGNSPKPITDVEGYRRAAAEDPVDLGSHSSELVKNVPVDGMRSDEDNVLIPVSEDLRCPTDEAPYTAQLHSDPRDDDVRRRECSNESSNVNSFGKPLETKSKVAEDAAGSKDARVNESERSTDVVDVDSTESTLVTVQIVSVVLESGPDDDEHPDNIAALEPAPAPADFETSCCDELFPPPPAWDSVEASVGLLVPEIIVRTTSDVDLSTNAYRDDTGLNESAPAPLKAAPLAADPIASPPEVVFPAVVEDVIGALCLTELRTHSHSNNVVDHDGSLTSSRSLNDELDADAAQFPASTPGAPPTAVDAACRLSESSVDGALAAIGRRGHVIEWLEQQAQIMLHDSGVAAPASTATGRDALVISDDDDEDDDFERPVFDGDLNDVVAALEAEAVAYPFHVGQTSTNSTAANDGGNDENIQQQASAGRLAAGGQPHVAIATFAEPSLATDGRVALSTVANPAGNDSVDNDNNSTLSISSEGDVEPVLVEDLPDPLEVLEMEASLRHSPPETLDKSPAADATESVWQRQAFVESSSSESCSQHEVKDVDPLDVEEILDSAAAPVKECDERLSDNIGDERSAVVPPSDNSIGCFSPVTDCEPEKDSTPSGRPRLTLSESTNSSESSTAPVYAEEPDAFAALDEEENSTPRKRRPGDDVEDDEEDEGCGDADSDSSQSLVSASTLDTFVHQVMRYRNIDARTDEGNADRRGDVGCRRPPSDAVATREAATPDDSDRIVWRYNDHVDDSPSHCNAEDKPLVCESSLVAETDLPHQNHHHHHHRQEQQQQQQQHHHHHRPQVIDIDVVERCAEQFVKKLVEDCCARSDAPDDFFFDQFAALASRSNSVAPPPQQSTVDAVDRTADQSACLADDELSILATERLEWAATDSSPSFDEHCGVVSFGDVETALMLGSSRDHGLSSHHQRVRLDNEYEVAATHLDEPVGVEKRREHKNDESREGDNE